MTDDSHTTRDQQGRLIMSAKAVDSALWSAWARQTATCLRPDDPNWPHPTETFWEDAMLSLERRWEIIRNEDREETQNKSRQTTLDI